MNADRLNESTSHTAEIVLEDEYKCMFELDSPEKCTRFFDSEKFVRQYIYLGSDLGAVIDGGYTSFKVWAPTAVSVVLNLYREGSGGFPYKKVDMTRAEKGVWTVKEECGSGTYYTYTVTTAFGTEEAVDPYARAVGVNGERGMVIDLSLTDPDGFADDSYLDTVSSYCDAVIWETHIRDFSMKNTMSRYKGKYLAFTETGLKNRSGFPTGIDYLVELGITHVQLLPFFDYETVDEKRNDEFNWGYDPKNYNAPEGSYSLDPYHGEKRIMEVKKMISSLHSHSIGVVMDVVYNHTYSLSSSLNKIVPCYYYRYTYDGVNSNGSGCGNEIASNRIMCRKFIIDSLSYWAEEYHIDGFRFDLMGVLDMETIKDAEKTLHTINPRCLIYGEGWSGGSCAWDYNDLATNYNIWRIEKTPGAAGGVAVFNDVIRDGLKGSVFNISDRGYINGMPTKENAAKVAFGICGGNGGGYSSWSVRDNMVVNYMSAHDNNTLWDKLKYSNPDSPEYELEKMNRLGAAIVMVSNGMAFMLAGEETLRTKNGDGNSYKSPDSINSLDWEGIEEGSSRGKMFHWYKNLIEMRKRCSWLRKSDTDAVVWDNNSIFVTYKENGVIIGIVIINPSGENFLGTLPEGEWKIIMSGDRFVNGEETASICVSVPPVSVVVLAK